MDSVMYNTGMKNNPLSQNFPILAYKPTQQKT
jgi:hypothetical protein